MNGDGTIIHLPFGGSLLDNPSFIINQMRYCWKVYRVYMTKQEHRTQQDIMFISDINKMIKDND